MSTHGLIGYINEDNMFVYIYCQYDNYIEHTGQILQKYYNSINLVKELVSGGTLISLGKYFNIINYNNRENKDISKYPNFFDDVCSYYGDEQIDIIDRKSISDADYQYVYMFVNNQWKVSSDYGYTFLNLENVINECKDDFAKIID